MDDFKRVVENGERFVKNMIHVKDILSEICIFYTVSVSKPTHWVYWYKIQVDLTPTIA